jgi:hypothetical protein
MKPTAATLCLLVTLFTFTQAQGEQIETHAVGFPRWGATLHQTLAGLYGPRTGDHRVLIQKIEVLRTDVTPWQSVDLDVAREDPEFGAGQSFAIIAHRTCTSAVGMSRNVGRNTDWFMITQNRLQAWELQKYSFRCLQSKLFRPAQVAWAQNERELEAYARKHFPRSAELNVHLYQKGIQLAKVGRVEDAELALANGDTQFDQTSYRRSDRRQGRKGRSGTVSDKEAARVALIQAIEAAREDRLNPKEEDASAVSEPIEPTPAPPQAPVVETPAEVARREAERLDRWERERDQRRYVETDGGWMLVDRYRRKRGPAEGEVWVSYDEMKRLQAQGEPAPSKPVVPEPPPIAKPIEAQPLFVQADGSWREVTPGERARGPGPGEVWQTASERQLAATRRALKEQQRGREAAAAPATHASDVTLVKEIDGKWQFVTAGERAEGPQVGEVWLTLAQMRTEMNRRQLEAFDAANRPPTESDSSSGAANP